MNEERARLIRMAYQHALVTLRQKHDDEFQTLLAAKYEEMGLEVRKRKSRMASRRVAISQEGTT